MEYSGTVYPNIAYEKSNACSDDLVEWSFRDRKS